MVTSGVSYATHYEFMCSNPQDGLLQDFSRLRLNSIQEQPVLYVAMATWVPKCNMYHLNKYVRLFFNNIFHIWLYIFRLFIL